MALVKHPAVELFENSTGCEAVTPQGHSFEMVEDDEQPHPLVSTDPTENQMGVKMKIHRGAFIGVALATAAAESAAQSASDAEAAKLATEVEAAKVVG